MFMKNFGNRGKIGWGFGKIPRKIFLCMTFFLWVHTLKFRTKATNCFLLPTFETKKGKKIWWGRVAASFAKSNPRAVTNFSKNFRRNLWTAPRMPYALEFAINYRTKVIWGLSKFRYNFSSLGPRALSHTPFLVHEMK